MSSSTPVSTPQPDAADALFVATQADLDEACASLSKCSLIAIDTEFVRESTYFAKLCLIQLATDKQIFCIDTLASLDLSALFDCLLADNVQLIAHSARQDVELIWQTADKLPPHLIDTQIAAGLLGLPSQIGLRELLIEILDIEIEKTMARTDWTKRPLSSKAIHYAATDVAHLLELWKLLAARLDTSGRMTWFEEDGTRALQFEKDPGLAFLFQRTKGSGKLKEAQIPLALTLLDWREHRAKTADRPRRWILQDDVIVAIVTRRPEPIEELRAIPGITDKMAERNADALLPLLRSSPEEHYQNLVKECLPAPRPDAQHVKSIQAQVRAIAAELNIEPEIIAARRDVVGLVLGDPPERICTGWRADTLANIDN